MFSVEGFRGLVVALRLFACALLNPVHNRDDRILDIRADVVVLAGNQLNLEVSSTNWVHPRP